jgi:hypothetical protein
MKPESFLRLLSEHSKLILALYTEVSDQPFSENLFIKLVKELDPVAFTPEGGFKILESLRKENLIEPVPRSNKEFEFFTPLLPLIEGLLNEQKLSLHSELIVRIDALNNLRNKLEAAITDRDLVAYHATCNDMDRLLRILKGQIDDSMQAVFRLVEEAKLFPKTMPLKKRYARTLDAWDQFVKPVLDMLSPTTPFSQSISRIENSLLNWKNDEYSSFLSLDSDQQRIIIIHGRLLDFQAALSYAVDNMGKKIYPIVQSVRLNTSVTRGATLALRLLEREPASDWVKMLGVGITKVKSVVRHGNDDFLESFVKLVKDNAGKEQLVPSISSEEFESRGQKQKESRAASQHEIIRDMRKQLPIQNAMSFIHSMYPSIDMKTLVTCFAKLSRTDGFRIDRDDNETIEIPFENKTLSFKNRHIVRK